MTSKVTYLGNLRTECVHLQSGATIITDAPTDNHGKGEAFSPTDLAATSLGTCMLTIMAIKSNDLGINLKESTVEVTKIMQAEPRRISKIIIVMNMAITVDEKTKIILERTAMNCPVLLSLNTDIDKEITINWK